MTIEKVLSNAHLEIDINLGWYTKNKLNNGDIEGYAKDLQREANEVLDFLRDHRSLDVHDVFVVREYSLICSHCKQTVDENQTYHPECCEKSIREWANSKQLIEFGYN